MLFGNRQWQLPRRNSLLGDMPQPQQQQQQQQQPSGRGLFGGWRNVAGIVGDALATANDMPALYAPQMMQRRDIEARQQEMQARQQQQQADRMADREDWQWQYDYERENPRPSTAQPHRWESNDGDVYELGPDGQPRRVFDDPTPKMNFIPDGQGGGQWVALPANAPTTLQAPVGQLGPVVEQIPGGQPAGTPPLSANRLDHITMMAESGGNPNAVSPVGARGLMQVMPATARAPGFGIRPSNGTQADDVRVGQQYRAAMERRYGGDLAKMWAAYNWGPGRVDEAVRRYGANWLDHAPAETRNYVRRNTRAAGRR